MQKKRQKIKGHFFLKKTFFLNTYIIYKDFKKRQKLDKGKIGFAETVSREPDPRIRIQIRMMRIPKNVLHPVYALPLVLRRAHRSAGTQRAKVVQAKTENNCLPQLVFHTPILGALKTTLQVNKFWEKQHN